VVLNEKHIYFKYLLRGDRNLSDPRTRTFRLEAELDEALREEAEDLGTSVNGLMNQILNKYVKADRYFDTSQLIIISPETMNNILANLTLEEAYQTGVKSGETTPKNRLLMRGKTVNRQNIIWFIEEILGEINGWFECSRHERDDHTLFLLRNSYGEKWSKFLAGYISRMTEASLDMEINIETTDRSLNFKLYK
jgi:hypothetical protein